MNSKCKTVSGLSVCASIEKKIVLDKIQIYFKYKYEFQFFRDVEVETT